jgi:hypothetical protein
VLLHPGNDFIKRLARELALGEFADVLQAFAAVELVFGGQAEHFDNAADLFARQALWRWFH